MSILLVRHGETEGNRDRIMQVASTPLSAEGLRQAELLAPRLAQLGVARILCSDLARARATAAPLLRLSGAELVLSELLRERDFGDLRGTPYSALTSDPFALDFVPPRGESWDVFHARVAQAFALITATRQTLSGNLIVITHGLVLRALLQRHLAWQEDEGAGVRQFQNTSVTVLAAEPPHAPSLLNCCAHLTNTGGDAC